MSSTKDIINQALDDLWAEEAEARLDAYERGEIATVSVQEAMAKYDKE
ncbi:MAG: addiction module protein [Alcanivorax sp.]|nr:addiction module protein [Alloalcanivorax marinus]MBM7332848.1 addiction module protein [Alloalcanivorax marinus]